MGNAITTLIAFYFLRGSYVFLHRWAWFNLCAWICFMLFM